VLCLIVVPLPPGKTPFAVLIIIIVIIIIIHIHVLYIMAIDGPVGLQ
jgi:hypothetical protein